MGDPIRIVVRLAGKRAPIRRATGIKNGLMSIGHEPVVVFVSDAVLEQLESSDLVEVLHKPTLVEPLEPTPKNQRESAGGAL
jgi:hypothetical protein